ncbi:MAG: transposase [Candidatus Sumerlaeia bacterium]
MRPFNPDGVLAYFISFRCYGTWLHGNDRGSMDRSAHHTYGAPKISPNPLRTNYERSMHNSPAIRLSLSMRQLVERTIKEVCTHRGWHLYAANAQDEHVHTVVYAKTDPERVMNSFKAWCTRRLRENPSLTLGLPHQPQPVWSRHGSTVWLWTEMQVSNAINYTLNGQGEPPSTYQE